MRLALAGVRHAFQNLLLRFLAEPLQSFQPAGAACLFELVEIADPEFVVEDPDFLEAEARNAQKLEDAGRILLSELLELTRCAGAKKFLDDGGGGFSDPGRLLQLTGGDHLGGIAIECRDRTRRLLECQRLESICFAQLDVFRDFVENPSDLRLVHAAIILTCNRATVSSWPSTGHRERRF